MARLLATILAVTWLCPMSFGQGLSLVPQNPEKPRPASATPEDQDGDGIDDAQEQELAEKYAPVIFHERGERNLPTNARLVPPVTSLSFLNKGIRFLVVARPTQMQLHWVAGPPQRTGRPTPRATIPRRLLQATGYVSSYDCCDRAKEQTFFFEDVPDAAKAGSPQPKDWFTYFHAYPNNLRGATIQYWRFYAFQSGGVPILSIGSHGGDWEGIHVVLNQNLEPVEVALLYHSDIRVKPWGAVHREGNHPKIFSGGNSHPSSNEGSEDGIRQETWTGGKVRRDGNLSENGLLINVGERTAALNGQNFIYYSGLWGSPGANYISSGYWGPAFNETQEQIGIQPLGVVA